ncbi:MAG: hypothetical protein GX886_10000, partial [Comamonadaceae bacterium]|nr:hypothetical protein [Comamonadaceae bacterium]
LRGYAALGLDVFGGMLPVIAASVASGGSAAVGAAVGGAQGGGSAAQQAEDAIVEMAKSPAADNGKPGATVLEQESAYYRELLAAGKTPKQALNLTRLAASRLAFAFTTPVSALGGAATSKLIHPATKVAAGAALPGRVAARTGASALEEGLQEAGEQIAQNAGTNAGAGTNIDLTDDTFGNFILGALEHVVFGRNRGFPDWFRSDSMAALALEGGADGSALLGRPARTRVGARRSRRDDPFDRCGA